MIEDSETKLIITDKETEDILEINSFIVENLEEYENSNILSPVN